MSRSDHRQDLCEVRTAVAWATVEQHRYVDAAATLLNRGGLAPPPGPILRFP